MRQFFIFLLYFTICLPMMAAPKWNSRYQAYIDQYKDIAIEEMVRYGIPASITLAQGLLESGAGQSELALKGNNHFGIKCHNWTGRTVYHDDDVRGECFRAYDSARESFEDHSKFLKSGSRYSSLFLLSQTDYKGWARGLKAAGYATNPVYAQSLIDIIEVYGLHQYDRATTYNKPADKPSDTTDRSKYNATVPYAIKIFNNNLYLYAHQGDTFKTIGDEVGISSHKLAKYNERDRHDVLQEGDIIYLQKKCKSAPKQFRNRPHVVKAGDSMYSIAQQYGMRLKSLYKKNHLSPDYQIRVGDRLKVY